MRSLYWDWRIDKQYYEDKGQRVYLDFCICNDGRKSDKLYKIRQGDKYGFCDDDFNIVIPLVYNNIQRFNGKYAEVQKDGETFWIDKNNVRYDNVFVKYKFLYLIDPHKKKTYKIQLLKKDYDNCNTYEEVVIKLGFNINDVTYYFTDESQNCSITYSNYLKYKK